VLTAVLTICTVLAVIPISLVELLCGYFLRDAWIALAVCVIGKTIGACTCFAISRTIATDWAERLINESNSESLAQMRRSVQGRPILTTILSRFSYIPAAVKNYGWPVLGVDFRVFLFAVVLEAPFFALPVVFIGVRAPSLARLNSKDLVNTPEGAILVGLSLLTLVLFVGVVRKS